MSRRWLGAALTCGGAGGQKDVHSVPPYAVLPADPAQLADVEMANIVLATTVDGRLSGLDRTSGAVLWTLHAASASPMADMLKPLVSSAYGAKRQTLEDMAAEAIRTGDPATLQALQGSGIYIVEPSSGGDLYVLRMHSEQGELRPQLDKMPFSLPELVGLSPFSLSSDETRIFVAEKHTRLVELNVFTGTVSMVFDSQDAHAAPMPSKPRASRPDADFAPIESPWVYIGRTDYTLTVHVRGAAQAVQRLEYSVYTPNSADHALASLWANPAAPHDAYGMLAEPQDNALVCYDLREAKAHKGLKRPVPPVVWRQTLNASVVDLFDVVFVPPTTSALDAPLLRPAVVPHNAGMPLPATEQGQVSSAYVGIAPGGSLFAMGAERYPLVEHARPAGLAGAQESTARLPAIQPWVGGYQVHGQRDTRSVPSLGPSFPEYVPLLGAAPAAPTLPPSSSLLGEAPGLNLMRVAGVLLLLWVVVRGFKQIFQDRSPLLLTTDTLRFEVDAPKDEPEAKAPVEAKAPTEAPSERQDEAVTPSDETKPRRRRRGKRAGTSVQAKAGSADTASDTKTDAPVSSSGTETLALSAPTTDALASDPGPSSLEVSDTVLGYGSSGTVVFLGTFQGRAVAVKRLLRDFVQMASKEVALLQSADNHPNVIRYYCQELTPTFLYIALERCAASLADLVERPMEFGNLSPLFEPRDAFQQITAGLRHLHSLSIVHRDIKPQNILITLTSQHKLRMLLSDFGLSKRMDGYAQSSFSITVNQPGGTVGWRAPEVLRHRTEPWAVGEEAGRLTRAVDIFSLGCVAFYMLTGGEHPFGSHYEREMHIMQQQPNLSALQATSEDMVEAQALIQRMIAHDPAARPTADAVAYHPFFWHAGRRLHFLQDVSDRFETLDRDPPAAAAVLLETNASAVIGADWRRRFDRAFLEDLGRFRRYDGSSVQDLLRVIRNKKHHFQDMQPQLKKQLSPMPDGFLLYFTRRFPLLFLHVYQTMEQLPLLRSEPPFGPYYQHEE